MSRKRTKYNSIQITIARERRKVSEEIQKEIQSLKYVSERVVNIKELENYIENAHLSILSLIQGIEKGAILSVHDVAKHLQKIDTELEKAYHFDFCVERRTTISKVC